MSKLFLGLGVLWLLGAVFQYAALGGDPDRGRVALQFLAMAAVNLAVAWFLGWLRDRRERAGRQP